MPDPTVRARAAATRHQPRHEPDVYADADNDSLLRHNAGVHNFRRLQPWLDETQIETSRISGISGRTCIRLERLDEDRDPIVLTLLDGAWERVR